MVFDCNNWRVEVAESTASFHWWQHGKPLHRDERARRNADAGCIDTMKRSNRSRNCLFTWAMLCMLGFDDPGKAVDLPLKAPAFKTVYDWTGFYIGGHVGYGGGSLGPGTNPVPAQGVFLPPSVTGFIGGYQAGYNRQFSDHVVLGIEADATFESPVDAPRQAPASFNATNDYYSTVRGRVGYAFDRWLPYLTGGFAWGSSPLHLNHSAGSIFATPGQIQIGWTAGAGVEFAASGNWSARL